MRRAILLSLLVLMSVGNLHSETTFTATASSTNVHVGEQIQITFTLNSTNGKNFQPPSFKGFTVLAGPSRSMSTQFINGTITSSMAFTYILLADAEGTFTIGPASIQVDGKTLTTNPITITIQKGSTSQSSQQKNPTSEERSISEQANEILRKNIFIRLEVDKSQVYLGESLTATYKLFIHPDLNILRVSVPKMPSFNGFWAQDFGIKELKFKQEIVDGTIFKVADLKQVVLIPQQTGNLTIEPMEIEFIVRLLIKQQRKRYRDPFDMLFDDPFFNNPFFSPNYRDFPYDVKSRVASVKVLPLPKNQPSEFSNAVGTFQLTSSIDKTKLKTGEVATLRLKISGKGNLKLLSPIRFELPSDIDLYEPKTIDNTNVTPSGITGSITFEYYLVPKNPGKYKIEPVKFAYFDLSKNEYVTLSSEPFTLEVEAGASSSQPILSNIKKEEVKFIGQDIRYIKLEKLRRDNSSGFFASFGYFVFAVLPVGLWMFFFVYLRRKEKLEGNLILLKSRRATKIAKERLKFAQKLLNQKKYNEFYEETAKTVWNFIADKLNIPPTELTTTQVREKLLNLNIDENLIESCFAVIQNCEEARFAPLSNQHSPNEILSQAMVTLSQLSEKLA
ncbi:MAG: BatD family protein [Candidatus Kapaibacteriales bacterium]